MKYIFAFFLLIPLIVSAEQLVPRMVLADGYTICASGKPSFTNEEAIEKSVYHVYFRRELTPWMKKMGISAKDSRFVFYGLRRIIDRVIAPKVTQEEIDLADAFFKQHNFPWPKEVWQRVVDEKNGHIPIKIEALKEGSVAFSGEPIIQITAEDGFGELAAWFESTLLQVWAPCERATLVRYWLDYHKSVVEQCMESHEQLSDAEMTSRAQQLMADMSARSSRSTEEMLDLGLASMLSLNSATPSAVFLANQDEKVGELAESSLAHRIVQAYEDEGEAYAKLYDFIKAQGQKSGSFVADCYDYENAVREYLLPLAKRGLEDGITVYARPDSGDLYDQVVFVLDLAKQHGLSREITTKDGRKLTAMTSFKVIQAEGMDFEKVKEINDRLLAAGYSPPHCVAFGVGGSLQHISRDNMSAAQKLAAVGKNDRPVMKIAIPDKESIPGVVKIVRPQDGSATVRTLQEEGDNEYVVYYDGKSEHLYREKFSDIQRRVIFEFHQVVKPLSIISPGILEKKIELRHKFAKGVVS